MNSTGFDEYRHLTEAARRLEAYKRMEPCIQNDGEGVIYSHFKVCTNLKFGAILRFGAILEFGAIFKFKPQNGSKRKGKILGPF